jgi:sporulation protein YlmC with PRC-barrel domain
MKSDASKSTTTTSASSSSASGSAAAIASQKPDQLLASKFKGADVLGSDDKKIGDVSDILFTKDGKIDAYLISVGGFLGVGSKEVALAPSSVQLIQDKDKNDFKLKVSMNKDQLAQAPNFEHYKEQRTTSGASSSGTGAAMAPRTAPNAGGMAPGGNPPANRP